MQSSGRPLGSVNKDKPLKEALRIEAALAEKGKPCTAPKGSLRWIARQALERAGTETAAFRELADRLDGKVPQAIVGDDDHPPVLSVTDDQRVQALTVVLARSGLTLAKAKE